MKIAVLIKQVPVSDSVEVDRETNTLIRTSTEGMINPSDLNALEMAIELKDSLDVEISVFTMAPAEAEKSLREALAMGCDNSYLISDRVFAGADTIATSKVIAEAIKSVGDFDLILCGAFSSDGATGQVGAMLAEYLDIPHLSEIHEIKLLENKEVLISKKVKNKEYSIKAKSPCLLTVVFGCNTPRLTTLRSMRAAKTKPMTIISNKDLKLNENEVGLKGSPTIIEESYEREFESKAVFYHGSGKDLAIKLKELLEKGGE